MAQGENAQHMEPQAAKYIGAHPPAFTQDEAAQIAEEVFGVSGTLRPLWGERDQNFAIYDAEGRPCFVLKLSNALEKPEELDLQLQALQWLERTSPDLTIPRLRPTRQGALSTRVAHPSDSEHAAHMITHLQGVQFGSVDAGQAAYRAAGAQAGQAAQALSGFFHPSAGHALFWDIRHIETFAHHAAKIRNRAQAKAVADMIPYFCSDVKPALARLRAQLIHHDTNPTNVLVDPDQPARMTGLVDFGDLLHGSIAQDVAVAAMELATESDTVLEDAAAVIAGYDSVFALQEDEVDLVYDLMVARAGLGLLIGATRQEHGVTSAEDQDYEEMYSAALDTLLDAGRDTARDAFRAACRFPAYTPATPRPMGSSRDRTDALIARRRDAMGDALPLTYTHPLHTEKGRGAWLFDVDGNPHLDCYNNVAHVGHCHPHVVRTVARQAATLNTNCRYAFESVVAYAERLAGYMPGDLGACLFVNSGSEAVDLALRMARSVSGQDGMLAMEGAYHGITTDSYAVSPATEWDAPEAYRDQHISNQRRDIGFLVNPDPIRGPFRAGENDLAGRYAADADRAIGKLQEAGHPPGVFIADTAFSSSGILDLPEGYLPSVAQKVRAAGGMIIADEVQYGFGRSGSHFWGFERYGITPDFVTLGKPIGNGIAVGCVVTTRAILDKFSAQHAFFSTFGGNPVACAAAGAVLDVIEREGLQQNARDTGGYLIDGLRELARGSARIGEVRGQGLFVGVDFVRDKASMEPDGALCSAIKDSLREQRILVSSDGYHGNVLKIRPPMVFSRENADMLIEGLRHNLNAL